MFCVQCLNNAAYLSHPEQWTGGKRADTIVRGDALCVDHAFPRLDSVRIKKIREAMYQWELARLSGKGNE